MMVDSVKRCLSSDLVRISHPILCQEFETIFFLEMIKNDICLGVQTTKMSCFSKNMSQNDTCLGNLNKEKSPVFFFSKNMPQRMHPYLKCLE